MRLNKVEISDLEWIYKEYGLKYNLSEEIWYLLREKLLTRLEDQVENQIRAQVLIKNNRDNWE